MTENIKKRFVVDDKGKKTAVILDIKTFTELIDEIDELDCALGFDQSRERNSKDIENGNFISINKFITKRNRVKDNRL